MAKMIFVFGGCRSGKSSYAVHRLKESSKVVYIATSLILDEEMQYRIRKHREDRPCEWGVVESPYDLTGTLSQVGLEVKYIIIDCLTMYLANHFGKRDFIDKLEEEERFEDWLRDDLKKLIHMIKMVPAEEVILISNEVGGGIVPLSRETRFFRDMSGLMNQLVAHESDEVIKMEVGLVNRLK